MPHEAQRAKPSSEVRDGPRGGWLPTLEGLRAVAAVAVLVHHVSFLSGLTDATGQVGGIMARLDFGVTLFFALSGFLLYRPFAVATIHGRNAPDARKYLRHRALRILPAYWALAAVALGWLNIDFLHNVWDWAVPLLLLQIYQPLRLPVGMEQTWSLSTEVAFYLALPMIAAIGRGLGGRTAEGRARRQLWLGGALILIGLSWTALVHLPGSPLPQLAGLWLPSYLDWFGVGVVLAVLASWPTGEASAETAPLRALRAFAHAPGTSWLLGGVLLWIASTPIAGPRGVERATTAESLTEHVVFFLAAWCFVAPLVGPRPGRLPEAVLGHPVTRYLGRISYGIFLWHLLAIEICLRVLGFTRFGGAFWSILALTVAMTLLFAAATYHLVEQPVQRLRRFAPGRRSRPYPGPLAPEPYSGRFAPEQTNVGAGVEGQRLDPGPHPGAEPAYRLGAAGIER